MINLKVPEVFKNLSQSYLVKASGFYSLSQVIRAVVSFGILALYTRLLPPGDFGKISLIWIFVVVSSMLISFRLNTAFSIKFYKVSKEENTKNIYSIFVCNLVVFGAVYFVFLSYPALFQKILRIQIARTDLNVVFLLILFMIFGDFYTNILMVGKKPRSYFLVMLAFNTVLVISSLVFLLVLKEGYISYLKAYLVSYITISLIGFRFFVVNYRPYKEVVSLINLKDLLKLGLPLVPTGLLLMLLTWADRYILNLYAGLAIVGIYTVGYRFSTIINNFVINPFGQALTPVIFKQFAQSKEEYKRSLSRVFKYYWIIMPGIMVAYFVFLKEIIQLFIGAKYAEGYNIVAIVLFGIILWGATNFIGATVVLKEKTGIRALFVSISVFFNIGLNFLLIPKYGMYGAAVATLLSYFLNFMITFFYTQKLVFVVYDYKFMLKSLFISLCFLAFVLYLSYLKINIVARIGLKMSVFLLFILVAYKFLGLKKAIKGFFNYGIKSEQAIS